MRVLSLNTNNSAGGATKSCIRLHQALLRKEIESDLLMLEQPSGGVDRGHSFYHFYTQSQFDNRKQQSLGKKIYKKVLYELGLEEEAILNRKVVYESKLISQKTVGSETMHFAQSQYRIQEHKLYKDAQIVHLHCMINNFLDYPSFFRNQIKPVVWTLHDMNPFTGGCVYSEGCDGFIRDCHNCPQLQGTDNPDYTRHVLKLKQEAFQKNQNIIIVSPSRWLLNQSQKSRLFQNFRHEYIPYGIDSKTFQPRDKAYSRKLLGLPLDKPVFLFVSHHIHNQRKGYNYLIQALTQLNLVDTVSLCAVGAKGRQSLNTHIFELGSITDERLMSIAYSAADVFIIPSLEDNLPNTVIESLLCGTPVIGFPIGGIPDMIHHGKNGFLCDNISVNALAKSIKDFLDNSAGFSCEEIRRDAITRYDSEVQVNAYLKVYNDLLTR